ncbi:hypothetical protein Vadar_028040 [Vaccinium darrowii]|uniref:Uncharacterized protein n=1 Tax=Vaccinium darrowii TaxID=229202 RepID=A0ACB7YHU9_9ERIC|nr:hypothetical protein Vadar_028040 [Vaccinium darrowii]
MASSSSSSRVPSLPPPRPKSPPEYPDLYGKRRELAKVQMLEREITFLEGELKFVETLPPASRCCKEYVIALAIVLYLELPVLISHGCAVLGAPLISKCHAAAISAAAIAVYKTVFHAYVVQCQNVGFAPAGLAHDALTRSHAAAAAAAATAAASVALRNVFRAQIAIVDVVALVLNAPSQTFVAVVQKIAAAPLVYVTRI